MCGIAGIFKPNGAVLPETLNRLAAALQHRGPDDLGFLGWSPNRPVETSKNFEIKGMNLAFVHRRLSIIDLSEQGWQPMSTADGKYSIIYNGEIYNYIELRKELEAGGYTFRSNSDTEVLLAAYIHWGNDALKRLVGMFAFAILDLQKSKLFLARDFFGIKPLYYAYLRDGFAFASEIKALLTLPEIERKVNPRRLYRYLYDGTTDNGSETFFQTIHQLPSAHYLEFSLGNFAESNPVRYWEIDTQERLHLSFQEAAARLRELFLQSVSFHLRSDVPVGSALSGGIDSSSIVMAMRHLVGPDLKLHTFSYLADDAPLNEEKWVDIINDAARTVPHKVRLNAEMLISDLNRLIEIQDEPFGSTSIYAQYKVFELARSHGIKVMLDGQGADELLGGYRFYLAARLVSLIRKHRWGEAKKLFENGLRLPEVNWRWFLLNVFDYLIPSKITSSARCIAGKSLPPPWVNRRWFSDRGVALRIPEKKKSEETLRQTLVEAVKGIGLSQLLRYEDRNSMAFSVESRVPFLTPALCNFILSLPEEYIISEKATSKAVFREAMRGIVPDAVLNRNDKIGFATPERKWLPSFANQRIDQVPAIDSQKAKKMLESSPNSPGLWRCVNVSRWAERFNVSFEV